MLSLGVVSSTLFTDSIHCGSIEKRDYVFPSISIDFSQFSTDIFQYLLKMVDCCFSGREARLGRGQLRVSGQEPGGLRHG